MSVKRIVRIIGNWQWPDLMQQTPGHRGVWDNVQFTGEPVQECHYLIILNNLEGELELYCPPEHVWRIVQEPPTGMFKSWHINPSYSSRTFTCDAELSGPWYIRTHPMLPWHVNRDYDFLAAAPVPGKPKMLSWITSTRNVLPGHKQRMNFLHYIKKKVPGLDLLGGNIRHIMNQAAKEKIEREQRELGFKAIEDKWAGLAPYKYALAIENYSGPDYWTEKIADCFLAWTVPIYYGCTNLEDYFPKESFIGIDIEKPGEAIKTIKKVLIENSWESRLKAISKARELVLNKYQFFPFISCYIHSQPWQGIPGKNKKTRLILSGKEKLLKKKSKPKICVVVCTYNREKLLPGCLESLANQSADKTLYEVLVIDNNSSDNTRDVANEFVGKFPNFRSLFEKNQGLSHARNLGVNEAAADYVGFIDDDARAKENWIETALKIIDEKQPHIFGGPAYPIFKDGKPGWFKDEYGIRGDMGQSGWLEKGFIIGTNIIFKKSLLKEYGGFDPQLGMKGDEIGYHEETRIVFRALKEKKKVYYSKELAVKDQLPDYKKSLAFFIYSKYKAGFDGLEPVNIEFDAKELMKLLKLINQTMDELNFALMKRDKEKFAYPESYIIEQSINKFYTIGQKIGFFLREDNLMERLPDSYFNKEDTAKIPGKPVQGNKVLKTIKEMLYFKFMRAFRLKKKPKTSGKNK
jgi:glycosyltransferase involved in cell wall biosynthesis